MKADHSLVSADGNDEYSEDHEEVLDLIALTEAKAESDKEARIPLEEIKKQLGI